MKNIFFIGGGTAGTVTPLVPIIYQFLKHQPGYKIFFISQKNDLFIDKLIDTNKVIHLHISAGKFRRYLSLNNFIDIFKIFIGFVQSIKLIIKYRPKLLISAGSFISVPLIIVGRLFKIKSLIHQCDLNPGLTNILCKYFATKITVSFYPSLSFFPENKVILTGMPIRYILNKKILNDYFEKFLNKSTLPLICVVGGSSGSNKINYLLLNSLPELLKYYKIIHISGFNRMINFNHKNYLQSDFIDDQLPAIMKCSRLIVSRAGSGFLSELSYLGLPSLIIPLPNSPQIKNAEYFASKKAIRMITEDDLNEDIFISEIKELMNNENALKTLSKNIKIFTQIDATEKFYHTVNNLL